MSITTGQVPVTTTSGTITAVALPPGPASVVLTNSGTALVFAGVGGSAVTATNGLPIPSGGIVPFGLLAGDPGWPLRMITAGGSATAGFLISTSYGLAQPGQD